MVMGMKTVACLLLSLTFVFGAVRPVVSQEAAPEASAKTTCEGAPANAPEVLPAEADHPLYLAGAVLYPVGQFLELVIFRPILAIFDHPFEKPTLGPLRGSASAQPSPNACGSSSCGGQAAVSPAPEKVPHNPTVNFQPRKKTGVETKDEEAQ